MRQKMVRESYPPQYGMDLVQVRLPTLLKRRLSEYAALHHQSMTEVVQNALEILLRRTSHSSKESGLCGIWKDDRSAEEILEDIRTHRTTLLRPR